MQICLSEACINFTKDDFGVVTAVSTALIAYFTYCLNININNPALDLQFDNAENSLILKNFGSIPAKEVLLVFQQIEINGNKVTCEKLRRSGGSFIFGKDNVKLTPKFEIELKNHAQFLICVWSYKRGLKHVKEERVFTRNPQHPQWVATIRQFVDKNHWEIVNRHKKAIRANFKTAATAQK